MGFFLGEEVVAITGFLKHQQDCSRSQTNYSIFFQSRNQLLPTSKYHHHQQHHPFLKQQVTEWIVGQSPWTHGMRANEIPQLPAVFGSGFRICCTLTIEFLQKGADKNTAQTANPAKFLICNLCLLFLRDD